MSIPTTTIGAYPKPDFVTVPDWFRATRGPDTPDPTAGWAEAVGALGDGFENLERAFHGCPPGVTRTVHMCCGYPDRLDNPDYPKADPGSYERIADAADAAAIDAVSIEDAHRHNDLSLLERFRRTTVILGVVAVARSRIETAGEIRDRLAAALGHIDPGRLVAAPDCGLGLLPDPLARDKLARLCEAARAVG